MNLRDTLALLAGLCLVVGALLFLVIIITFVMIGFGVK